MNATGEYFGSIASGYIIIDNAKDEYGGDSKIFVAIQTRCANLCL